MELLNQARKIDKRYQTPFGIAIWGFTAPGEAKEIKVDGDGHLQIDAISNPPNLDVPLSTRLSEATFKERWDGGIYGFDGAIARKVKTDAEGYIQVKSV